MHSRPPLVIDARSITPGATGVGRSVRRLTQSMIALAPERRFALLAIKAEHLGSLADAPNVEVHQTPWDVTDHPAGDLWLNFRLKPLLQRLGAALFHGPAFHHPWRGLGLPSAVTIPDLAVFDERRYTPKRFRQYLRWVIRAGTRNATRVIAISESVRRDCIERLGLTPNRVSTVPIAAAGFTGPAPAEQVEALRRQLRLTGPYILSVGSPEPRKNPMVLIRAVASIPAAERPVIVWAGADGYQTEALNRQAIQRLGGEGFRRFSRINDEDLNLLRAGATAVACPSFHEGFGMPVLEAMQAGAPVLCSDIAAHREIAADAALFADPDDPKAWAMRLREALGSESLRARLVESGRRQARKYHWDKSAKRMLAIYDEMLEHGPASET